MNKIRVSQTAIRLDNLLDDYTAEEVILGLHMALIVLWQPSEWESSKMNEAFGHLVRIAQLQLPAAPGSRERRNTENETP